MTSRKFTSLCIGSSFVILLLSGVVSFFEPYAKTTATVHTVFGLLFSIGVFFHIKNNLRSLKAYATKKVLVIVLSSMAIVVFGAYFQYGPFGTLMKVGARHKAGSAQNIEGGMYNIVAMDTSKQMQLNIDVLRGAYYWHPQMAIWAEDLEGNHLETFFVSKATAKGLFFGGRNKQNFKDFDANQKVSKAYRRVNALPVWSFNRGVVYADGEYVPTNDNPLPDAITGATLTDSFHLSTSTNTENRFKLKIEINVAFDDNEYYSEFDFPDDAVFHNGTGQLGQPSIVFETLIDPNVEKEYYLMDLVGHGHHSAQNGKIYADMDQLTTAKQIVERIVIGSRSFSNKE